MGAEASVPLPDHAGPLSLATRATGDVDSDESLLLTENEAFVYKIPPRACAEGHAAASWGLDAPVATCALRVTAWGDNVALALWRRVEGGAAAVARAPSPYAATHPLTLQPATAGGCALVALCTFVVRGLGARPLSFWLEPTVDSSRYFVMRCVKPGGAPGGAGGGALLLGVGFRHRESAFSLRASLADHAKRCERLATAAAGEEAREGGEGAAPPPPPPPAPQQQQSPPPTDGGADDDEFSAFESAPPRRAPVPLLAPPRSKAPAS
jgi:hypothetical protein